MPRPVTTQYSGDEKWAGELKEEAPDSGRMGWERASRKFCHVAWRPGKPPCPAVMGTMERPGWASLQR